MKFKINDILVNRRFEQPIYRKIKEVRRTGYSWIYVESNGNEIAGREYYSSEDSSDPFFECGWELSQF